MPDDQSPDSQKGDDSHTGDDASTGETAEGWMIEETDYQVIVPMSDGTDVTVVRDKETGKVEIRQTIETPDKKTTQKFRIWNPSTWYLPRKMAHGFGWDELLANSGKVAAAVGISVAAMFGGYMVVTSGESGGDSVQIGDQTVEQPIEESGDDVDSGALPGLDDEYIDPDEGLPGLEDDDGAAATESQEDLVVEDAGADDVIADDVDECGSDDSCSPDDVIIVDVDECGVDDPCSPVDVCVDVDGCDPEGDPMSSKGLSSTGLVLGEAVDLLQINFDQFDPTTYVIIGQVVGDGQAVSNSADGIYQISARFDGALGPWETHGWDGTIEYYDGELRLGWVFSNELVDGEFTRTIMKGPYMAFEWTSASDFIFTILNIEEGLPVEGIVVTAVDDAFSDEASCTNGCPLDEQ